ncbi:MAG: hypothetical protein ABI592_14290 [Acidobacteriota bacterium]
MTLKYPLAAWTVALAASIAAPLRAEESVSAGGIRWTVPHGWTAGTVRPMRVATYVLPAGKGGEPGECGVFYFGHGQGGTAEENIARWRSQFEGAPAPQISVRTVDALRIHQVTTSGTYLASAGPMMPSQGKKPNYALAGVIVEAPEGLVFFKCTGPAAAIAAARQPFDALIRSIRKAPVATF